VVELKAGDYQCEEHLIFHVTDAAKAYGYDMFAVKVTVTNDCGSDTA
jgi:hypothetical protein